MHTSYLCIVRILHVVRYSYFIIYVTLFRLLIYSTRVQGSLKILTSSYFIYQLQKLDRSFLHAERGK